MARLAIVVLALCVVFSAAIVSAGRPTRTPFKVVGRVYCDTCKAGYETTATTYIKDARVRVECKDRKTFALLYSKEATTDASGTYEILVNDDHADQMCDCLLVHSPQDGCNKFAPGRDRSRLALTSNNGITSYKRFANAMGFEKDEADAGCTEVLAQYQELDEEN
jgi:hypothetical protein